MNEELDDYLSVKLFIEEKEIQEDHLKFRENHVSKSVERFSQALTKQHSPLAQHVLHGNMRKNWPGTSIPASKIQTENRSDSPASLAALKSPSVVAVDLPKRNHLLQNVDQVDEEQLFNTFGNGKNTGKKLDCYRLDNDYDSSRKRNKSGSNSGSPQITFKNEKSRKSSTASSGTNRKFLIDKQSSNRSLVTGGSKLDHAIQYPRTKTWWITKPTAALLLTQSSLVILFTLFVT